MHNKYFTFFIFFSIQFLTSTNPRWWLFKNQVNNLHTTTTMSAILLSIIKSMSAQENFPITNILFLNLPSIQIRLKTFKKCTGNVASPNQVIVERPVYVRSLYLPLSSTGPKIARSLIVVQFHLLPRNWCWHSCIPILTPSATLGMIST